MQAYREASVPQDGDKSRLQSDLKGSEFHSRHIGATTCYCFYYHLFIIP